MDTHAITLIKVNPSIATSGTYKITKAESEGDNQALLEGKSKW